MATSKPEVLIRDWALYECWNGHTHMCGVVNGHRNQVRVPDGYFTWTSEVVHADPEGGVVETRNTLYCLEGPAVHFSGERVCP